MLVHLYIYDKVSNPRDLNTLPLLKGTIAFTYTYRFATTTYQEQQKLEHHLLRSKLWGATAPTAATTKTTIPYSKVML